MIKNVPIILNLQFYIIIAFYFSAVLALHTTLSTTRYPLIRWGVGGVTRRGIKPDHLHRPAECVKPPYV